MGIRLTILVLQLLFNLPTADVRWASRVVAEPDGSATTVIVLTYPAPTLKLVRSCMVMYEGSFTEPPSDDYRELERQCVAPPHTVGDFFVWPGLNIMKTHAGFYGMVTFINMKGESETHYAIVPVKDS